jgi:prepilin-type N-terminal cleavage/methylation domain-containing protein
MLPLNVRRQDRGFTMIEIIVTVVVAGILMAVAVPSLLGLLSQTRVKDGLRQVEGSLKEAQRQAMRQGQTCKIIMDAANNTIKPDPTTPRCLSESKTISPDIKFKGDVADPANNANLINVSFTHKGNNNGGERTIAIYRVKSDGQPVKDGVQKCVIITSNLGGIKSSSYWGDVSSVIVQGDCRENRLPLPTPP